MIVKECLDKTIPKLTSDCSAVEAFDVMKTSGFHELPIIDKQTNTFLGMISEKELLADLGAKHIEGLISPTSLSFVHEEDSCLEALRFLSNSFLKSIPVLDGERQVLGLAAKYDLLEMVAKSFHFDFPGSVIQLLSEQRDFVMHEVLRIIEQEHVKVLACSTSEVENETSLIRVTLKLNQFDSGKVIAVLRRYGYVVESISDKVFEQDYLDKADAFLHFLSI